MKNIKLLPEGKTKIPVKVHPSAPKSEIAGFSDGILTVRVAAPPVENKANQELIELLSRALGVSQRSLTILKGHTSRNKLILIDGLNQDEARKRLLISFASGTATKSQPER